MTVNIKTIPMTENIIIIWFDAASVWFVTISVVSNSSVVPKVDANIYVVFVADMPTIGAIVGLL